MLSPVPALTNYVTLRPKASNLFQLLDAYFLTCGFQILSPIRAGVPSAFNTVRLSP
jgi:hypothetical protein